MYAQFLYTLLQNVVHMSVKTVKHQQNARIINNV